MANVLSIVLGAVQLIAGIFLTLTGVGGGLGLKLILSGALSLISSLFFARTGREGWKSSPRYGFDNLTNTGREGAPIPVVYGKEKVSPGFVSVNLKEEGGKEVLYLLGVVSEGEIESITEVRLNDTPITAFPEAVVDTRLGTASQTVIPGFNEIGSPYEAGTRLSLNATHVHEMKNTADEVVFAFVWPGGLYHSDDNGDRKEGNVGLAVEYKLIGEADKDYKPWICPAAGQGFWRRGITTNEWKMYGKTGNTLRRKLRVILDGKDGRLARGQYVFRIKGGIDDASNRIRVPTLATVLEIVNDQRAYANTALIGIKCPATEQLAGQIPSVTILVKGKKVKDPRTGLTAWSQNPALIVRDLIVNTRHGLGRWISEARIDDGVGGTWRTVADACDATVVAVQTGVSEARWQLDYVMDVKAPASEHMTQMLTTFRAGVFQADGLVKITQDIAAASSRSFESRMDESYANRRNVLAAEVEGVAGGVSSLVTQSSEWSERPTVVRLRYVDRDRAYKQRVFEIRNLYSPSAVTVGTFIGGEKISGGTSKAEGYFVAYINNRFYYTQSTGAVAFAAGEIVTGKTSASTVYLTGAVVTEEVPERALEFNGFGITRRTQAMREARFHLNKAMLCPVLGSWGVFLGDLDLLPYDVVDVSADVPAYTAKKFSVLRLTYGMDGRGRIEAREYHADVYADNVDTANADAMAWKPGGEVAPGLRIATDTTTTVPATPASTSSATPPANGTFGSTGGTSSKGKVSGSSTKSFISSIFGWK